MAPVLFHSWRPRRNSQFDLTVSCSPEEGGGGKKKGDGGLPLSLVIDSELYVRCIYDVISIELQ